MSNGGAPIQNRPLIAAIKLLAAQDAMQVAADALDIVGGEDAKLHAAEMRGAIKIARRWELEMRRQHSIARTSWRGE